MRRWQAIGLVAIVVLAVMLVVAFVLPARIETPPSPTPVTRPSPSASGAPPTTAAPTTAPSGTPSPTPISLYVNETSKYSILLPPPYRKSARLGPASRLGAGNPQTTITLEAFTARTEPDEAAAQAQPCSPACPIWNYVAVVEIFTGVSQTPRDWYTSGSGGPQDKIEDTTVDGRTAIRVTNGGAYPMQLVVKNGDRIYRVAYQIYPGVAVPAGASKEKLDAILASFKFLS